LNQVAAENSVKSEDKLDEDEVGLRHEPNYGIFPTRRFCYLYIVPLIALLIAPLVPPAQGLAFLLNIVYLLLLLIDYRRASVARSLIVKRVLKQRLSLGVENKVSVRVANLGSRALKLKIVDDAPATFTIQNNDFEFILQPGEERELEYIVTPHRRGDYEFRDLHVETLGPWGLARRVYQVSGRAFVKVYPNLKGVEQWALLTRKRHLAEIGVHKIRKRGQGSEFDQLRLYNQDDEYRSINWKATARRNLPITSVYQTEKSQSVVVLLDAGRRMAAWVGGLSKLDYAINASLLLAYVASVSDDNISLGVFNKDLLSWLAPRKGRMQYRRFMEQLYACEADLCHTNYRASFVSLSKKMKKRSLVVIMTDVLDPDSAAELEQAVSIFRPRHLPLVVSLRDPTLREIAERQPVNSSELYETVVAQEVFLDRRRMARDIQRRGVYTVDAAPEDFSVAVVNEYLRLKARREL
jgi:uncharacterized protein (DUF58 family)